jgi:hypothetical protein
LALRQIFRVLLTATLLEGDMTRFITAILFFASLSFNVAWADDCDATAEKIALTEGVEIDHRTDVQSRSTNDIVFFKHPSARSLQLKCEVPDSAISKTIYAATASTHTDLGFQAIVAGAAQIALGEPQNLILRGMDICRKAAIAKIGEVAESTYKGVSFECQATVAGGGSISVTVYKRKN